ncbi:MAG: chromosome segregation protein SMC [Clostridia bacterium]|nr:chromosome segregation protein SMC [Clostridia bacterium]
MILKSIEMQGFKSFPDKTVLKLQSGITGVVGPNGSGKSNIADAVRWVLGEQSSKSLRGSKMEDVIFSGNATGRRSHGFAEVSLTLDNKDRTLNNCEEDEVTVTRRFYRSGESEYLLNGEGVRLRDVHELFMDTGLGRDGYSMVSQGKVAELISSKSSKRREMLEEAAGISHFRYRRTDATRKLEQAQENLVRLKDILGELESRVGPLKTQKEKAQKFLVLSAEKKDLEIGLWLHTIEKSKNNLKLQEDKLTAAKAHYEEVSEEIERLNREIEETAGQSRDITASIDFIHQSNMSLEEQASKLDGEIAVEKSTISHNEDTIERIKKDIDTLSDTRAHINERISSEEEDIENLQKEIEQKKLELAQAVSEITKIRLENDAFADEILKMSQSVELLTVEISEQRIKQSTAESSIDEILSRSNTVEEMLSSRQAICDEIEQKSNLQKKELEEIRSNELEIKNSISGYEMKANSRREKSEKLKEKIETLEFDLHRKQSRVKMLDDLEKNMEGYSGSVKAVMKQTKREALRGIHAPLSQLITVDEEYAVAVETALGASIQHIVTETENDAKRAISFLKENRLGRATFLPLTAIKSKPFQERNLDDEYGFVDMADRLVKYDAKYDEIIKYQLGHIAVAQDMDCAIAIAKKYSYKFKIVTLDGQVINTGGSMTGGSRGQNSGMLSRLNEIEKLNSQIKEFEKELEKLRAEYKLVNEDLALSEGTLSAAQADLLRVQEDIIRKESSLKLTLGQFETVKNGLDELREEQQSSKARLDIFTKASKESAAQIEELSQQLNAVRARIDAKSSDREKLAASGDDLGKRENEINLDILALNKDIDSKRRSIEDLKLSAGDGNERKMALEEEIEQLKKANVDVLEHIASLEEEAGKLRTRTGNSKEEIAELISRRDRCDSRVNEYRRKERQLHEDREKLSGENARLEERKAAIEKEYTDTVNKLYDEYQLSKSDAQALGIVIEDVAEASRTLNEIKSKIRALGSVNVDAIEEYDEVSQRYEFMKGQIEDIEKSRDELLKLINELTGKMSEQFREQFARINSYFGETFSELFGGGKAQLVLEDELDVLESNIEIKVQPPGKNVKNIDLLSGGEKGLSAIALLFAILKVTPAPFCVFDEVEAALDDVNVTRYAQYVRRMTKNTQFILITHRRGTMEEADMLYGVTMQEEGVSKMLELKTAEMAKKMGLA